MLRWPPPLSLSLSLSLVPDSSLFLLSRLVVRTLFTVRYDRSVLTHAVRRTGSASVRAERSGARRDVKYARSRPRGRASSMMTIYVGHGERHKFARNKL